MCENVNEGFPVYRSADMLKTRGLSEYFISSAIFKPEIAKLLFPNDLHKQLTKGKQNVLLNISNSLSELRF